jgi:very-short-patch-repair endonuclease
MSSTREVIDFAKANSGIVTSREASALGLGRSTLSRRVKDGVLARIAPGVFALPGTASRPDITLRAACRSLGAVVSHESAAIQHGMRPVHQRSLSVTVSHRTTHSYVGLTLHQSTDLLEPHVTHIEGLPVTTPPRTVIDLAKTTAERQLGRILDNALAAGTVSFDELTDLFGSLARRGKTGTTKLRRLIEDRSAGMHAPESELEARLIELLDSAGLPAPESQFRAPWLLPINGRVDFAYRSEKLVIEADGRKWHSQHQAFERDRLRDNTAQLAGWRVLRFTWRMIHDDPASVVSTVRQALRESG